MPRPKGSKNKIKKESTVRIRVPLSLLGKIKIFIKNYLKKNYLKKD